ncbi:MAG: hypothetical protein ACOX3E_00775 [Desulfomonilia bacterium]
MALATRFHSLKAATNSPAEMVLPSIPQGPSRAFDVLEAGFSAQDELDLTDVGSDLSVVHGEIASRQGQAIVARRRLLDYVAQALQQLGRVFHRPDALGSARACLWATRWKTRSLSAPGGRVISSV